jgi:hypothetical protein
MTALVLHRDKVWPGMHIETAPIQFFGPWKAIKKKDSVIETVNRVYCGKITFLISWIHPLF